MTVRGAEEELAAGNSVRHEKPALLLPEVTVCLHYVEMPGAPPAKKLPYPNCPILRSMELDLLSYRFQADPPMGSQCETKGWVPVEIVFPDEVTYDSEGRSLALRCPKPLRAAQGNISCTVFLRSGVKVWHVALSPAPGNSFSEFDIIKLIHLYDGRTEGTDLARSVKFRVDGGEAVGQERLPEKLLWAAPDMDQEYVDGALKASIRAGTVEVLIGEDAEGVELPQRVLSTVSDACESGNPGAAAAAATLTRWLEKRTPESRTLEAFAGVVTGILDFEEVDTGEVLDMLRPTVRGQALLTRIHRSTLTSIAVDDRSMRACWSTVGISPYLILPHAVLLQNEVLAESAGTVMEKAGSSPKASLRSLEEAQASADRSLSRFVLPNIFNYDTERALFEVGSVSRGAVAERAAALARLQELEGEVEAGWESRRDKGQMAIAVLLAVISVLSLKDIVFEIVGTWRPLAVQWGVLCGLAVLIPGLIAVLWSTGRKK